MLVSERAQIAPRRLGIAKRSAQHQERIAHLRRREYNRSVLGIATHDFFVVIVPLYFERNSVLLVRQETASGMRIHTAERVKLACKRQGEEY